MSQVQILSPRPPVRSIPDISLTAPKVSNINVEIPYTSRPANLAFLGYLLDVEAVRESGAGLACLPRTNMESRMKKGIKFIGVTLGALAWGVALQAGADTVTFSTPTGATTSGGAVDA